MKTPLTYMRPRGCAAAPSPGVRDALSGYQDGRCAYCHNPFTDIGTSRVAVDHVLPFMLMTREWQHGDLHQVWNLALACYACNSAKHDRPPVADWMPWLERRGEYLIASHHPLRETLISQLGPDHGSRHQTLARRHTEATEMIPLAAGPLSILRFVGAPSLGVVYLPQPLRRYLPGLPAGRCQPRPSLHPAEGLRAHPGRDRATALGHGRTLTAHDSGRRPLPAQLIARLPACRSRPQPQLGAPLGGLLPTGDNRCHAC